MSTTSLSTRTYLKEFGSAMIAYAVILPLSIVLIEAYPTTPWRVAFALAPVLPIALVLRAVLRGVARMDELQRRIQFEALVMAVSGAIVLTFAYGALQNVGLPALNLMVVTPLLVALWGGALTLASRRYR